MLKIAHDIIYKHPLDKNHRFPMEKYDLILFQLIKEKAPVIIKISSYPKI